MWWMNGRNSKKLSVIVFRFVRAWQIMSFFVAKLPADCGEKSHFGVSPPPIRENCGENDVPQAFPSVKNDDIPFGQKWRKILQIPQILQMRKVIFAESAIEGLDNCGEKAKKPNLAQQCPVFAAARGGAAADEGELLRERKVKPKLSLKSWTGFSILPILWVRFPPETVDSVKTVNVWMQDVSNIEPTTWRDSRPFAGVIF
jgi:hypothetical protein